MLCCDDGQSSEDIPKVRLIFKDGELIGYDDCLPTFWELIWFWKWWILGLFFGMMGVLWLADYERRQEPVSCKQRGDVLHCRINLQQEAAMAKTITTLQDGSTLREMTIDEWQEENDRECDAMHVELVRRLGPKRYGKLLDECMEDFITSYMTGTRGDTSILYRLQR